MSIFTTAAKLTLLRMRVDKLEAAIARKNEALKFYADPYGRLDEYGEIVRVPDFYSELSFGDLARRALKE